MKHLFAVLFALLIGGFAKAQTNAQLFYDFGSDRKFVTLTLEMFKADKWGNTYFFVDHDFNYDEPSTDSHVLAPGGSYLEIARCLNFWQESAIKAFSLQVEYNGGVTKNYPINTAWLFGIDYFMHDKSFNNTLNLKALYKTIRKKGSTVPMQLTAVWNCKDIFGLKGLTFDGFADFWWETHGCMKEDGTWTDKSSDEDYMADVISKGLDIQVCGIIRQSESSYAASIDAGMIGYTAELAEYVVSENEKSEIVKQQLDNPDTDVFTGLPFSNGEDIDMSQVDMRQIVASMNLSEEQQAYISQMSDEQLFEMLKEQGYFAQSTATYDDNIEKLGFADLAKPSVISLYCSEFADKDRLTDLIDKYNDSHSDSEITYTDYIGLMLSSVTKIIDAITYVLIAFVAISLIVSSIMIGIITYISVLERTKEIGILRSIGASKKDISRVFNAETFIIGLVSGAIGILVTVLLNIPISKVIEKFVNVPNVSSLPVKGAVILVVISVVLTLIGGLIPSKMAAKKDPVIALRSE